MNKNSWYVITGGPCAGKTTLLTAIKEKGYEVVDEAARLIIETEIKKGRTLADIRKNEFLFQQLVLRKKVAVEKELPKNKIVFLDRGIPDSVAYYIACGFADDAEMTEALKDVYYKKVFLLNMIGYALDNARNETEEEANRIHELLESSYRDLGFPVIKVPVLPIQERVEFILNNL
ncbi:ATP-binding protein [Candidatus Wolfebacteria bacterium]|nr:ATP-binding protein [Candidatus Wolfebacteria bacterium]